MKQLRNIEVEDYLHECVNVAPEAIQEEFVRVPGELAYWGERASAAFKRARMAKLEREEAEARAFLNYKATHEKATVDALKAHVAVDELVHAARVEEVEAEAFMTAERNRYEAIRAKKDVLQSMGAIIRAEMERDPVTRSKVRGDGW